MKIPNGNAAQGKKVFVEECSHCHAIEKGEEAKYGPNLRGIVNQKAGTIPGFKYTNELRNRNVVWTEEFLYNYLTNPQKYLPGVKLFFEGLEKAQDRADVIAYMKSCK